MPHTRDSTSAWGGGALDKDRYYSFSGGRISYMNEIGSIMEVLVYFPYPISGFKMGLSREVGWKSDFSGRVGTHSGSYHISFLLLLWRSFFCHARECPMSDSV